MGPLVKGQFHEPTNRANERKNTVDKIGMDVLIGQLTNVFYFSIVLWSPTCQWPTNGTFDIWSAYLANQIALYILSSLIF